MLSLDFVSNTLGDCKNPEISIGSRFDMHQEVTHAFLPSPYNVNRLDNPENLFGKKMECEF